MLAYSKAIFRVGILFVLMIAAFILSRPASLSALQDCCQTCENKYDACVASCKNNVCKSQCERQLGLCTEDCPACQ